MKKAVKWILFVIFTITLISCQGQANNENNAEYERAEKVLKDHLVKRYGEEFEIFLMGRREFNNKVWYEAEIMPSKYIGTPKEDDSYYWATGNVNVNGSSLEAGDTYGRVLLNEGANEFFGKKVEELFGPNYLCVMNVEGPYTYRNFAQESESRKKMYDKNPQGNYDPISGGIYIYGRVDNNEDREKYRKKIFELLQYFKETGNFEYVALWIAIFDERVLNDEFIENIEDQEVLIKLYEEGGENYLKERSQIMNKYSGDLDGISSTNKYDVIKNYKKSNIYGKSSIGLDKLTFYNELLISPIFSKKHIITRGIKSEKEKEYEKLEDVEFSKENYYEESKGE